MASKNIETIKRAHNYFNTRKLQDCANEFADRGVYHDLPRGKDFPKNQFVDFMNGWIAAFSDCQIANAKYFDAGDTVIAQFEARGTNDGNMGGFPSTNKKLSLPYCEIVRFDAQGKIAEVTSYYDALTLLSQLGHLQRPREVEMGAPTP